MAEPRDDMFPDPSPTDPGESELPHETPPVPAQPVVAPAVQPAPNPQPAPRDSTVPLAALHEEREKRKKAEDQWTAAQQEIERLRATTPPVTTDDTLSDTEKELRTRVYTLEREREDERLLNDFPELKEKSAEFEEFRKEYAGFPAEKVAKVFLAENAPTPRRKGLEKPGGSQRQGPSTELSLEDIDRIRTTNPRLYAKMAQEGKIGNEPYKL